jgi:hypothetical protein
MVDETKETRECTNHLGTQAHTRIHLHFRGGRNDRVRPLLLLIACTKEVHVIWFDSSYMVRLYVCIFYALAR